MEQRPIIPSYPIMVSEQPDQASVQNLLAPPIANTKQCPTAAPGMCASGVLLAGSTGQRVTSHPRHMPHREQPRPALCALHAPKYDRQGAGRLKGMDALERRPVLGLHCCWLWAGSWERESNLRDSGLRHAPCVAVPTPSVRRGASGVGAVCVPLIRQAASPPFLADSLTVGLHLVA